MRRRLYLTQQALAQLWRQFTEELIRAPIDPVLHLSPLRLRVVAFTMGVGYLLFYLIWTRWSPQPYESFTLRLTSSLLGLSLALPWFADEPQSRRTAYWFNVVCFVNLPVHFWVLYIANQGNDIWLASTAAMILIYYQLTDWRIATVALLLSGFSALSFANGTAPESLLLLSSNLPDHAIVFAFCIAIGMALGMSNANLRRERLNQMLSTIGIVAHELRTPLATISLLAQALEARFASLARSGALSDKESLDARAQTGKLAELVKLMNQQINTQIANAGLLKPSASKEEVRMSDVVNRVMSDYPFASKEERDCVVVRHDDDFVFIGSFNLANQMLVNLLKNALRALAAKPGRMQVGDIAITLRRHGSKGGVLGQLIVEDQGIGMSPAVLKRIFDPFFTTNTRSGHGLGLTFCMRAAETMKGRVLCESEEGKGTRFTIEFPLAQETERSG